MIIGSSNPNYEPVLPIFVSVTDLATIDQLLDSWGYLYPRGIPFCVAVGEMRTWLLDCFPNRNYSRA